MWLSEIEELQQRERERNKLMVEEGIVSSELGEIYTERMARVIRELASYMRANNALEGVNSGIDPSDIPRLRKVRQTAWNNLSPDAKELLNG